MEYEAIKAVRKQYPLLGIYGFYTKRTDVEPLSALNLEKLSLIRKWVREQPTSTTKKCYSYSLKHLCEDEISWYVANGEMILACLLEGVKINQKDDDINAYVGLKESIMKRRNMPVFRATFGRNNVKIYTKENDSSEYWRNLKETQKNGWPYICVRGNQISCDWAVSIDFDLDKFNSEIRKTIVGNGIKSRFSVEGIYNVFNVKREDMGLGVARKIAIIADKYVKH